LTTRFKPIQV